jgi:maleylacetoacetate isomerase
MKLVGYFRSSAAYRVRIALNFKGLEVDHDFVQLAQGEQNEPAFAARNPQKLVPVLEDGPNQLIQSLAIVEYLEETHPEPPLLPIEPAARARVRALAQIVACEIHPLNNLRVLGYLTGELGIAEGLEALEAVLAASPDTGRFCHGDRPGLADICLVPQLFNARRFGCQLSAFPTLLRIDLECGLLSAFSHAAPDAQPDAQ